MIPRTRYAWIPLLAVLSSCVSREATSGARGPRIIVDPRIELGSIVQLLSGYLLVSSYASAYKADAASSFSRLAHHPAVETFRRLSAADFNFDAVPKVLYRLSPPPDLAVVEPIPPEIVARAGGRASLDTFLTELRDFAKTSDFMTFFDAHRTLFAAVRASADTEIQGAVETLRAFAGVPLDRAVVVLGLLLHHRGFADRREIDGRVEAWAFLGPSGTSDDFPTFGPRERIEDLTWHEFAHTFVNPLTAHYGNRIADSAMLFSPIRNRMAEQMYPEWTIAVNEHMVRAITIALTRGQRGAVAGDDAERKEVEKGFIYVPELVRRLGEYASDRARYPTIASFYPRLLSVFDELAKEQHK